MMALLRLCALASAMALQVLGPVSLAWAQFAVSANDGKVKLVEGVVEVQKNGKDTVAIIDLNASPPRIMAELDVPCSVVSPPMSVAVSPKADLALVTAAMKIDEADPTKLVPDDKLTVIDLSALKQSLVGRLKSMVGAAVAVPNGKPNVVATLHAGKGAAGVSINSAGTLALVANRSEGTVSVFTINGLTVSPVDKIDLGNPDSGPSQVVFTRDGRTALVTLDSESAHKVAILNVDGIKVEYTRHDLNAGLRPYAMDVASKGDVAVVANAGRGQGDNDTVSVIDLQTKPIRVVNTVTVGPTPEGIKMSADGKYLAVAVTNGTDKARNSPYYRENGLLQLWRRSGTELTKLAEAPIGRWCQGIAWSSNSKTVIVQCMVEEELEVYKFSGVTTSVLQKVGTIRTKGGPAGIPTAEP
jgi:DNA-binding beta-propeller fold protein YncE